MTGQYPSHFPPQADQAGRRRWKRLAMIALPLLIITVLAAWWAQQFFSETPVTIDINGNVREIRTDAGTVGEALQQADTLIDPADVVTPPLDTPLESGMTISVVKASQLVLEVDGEVRRVYTHTTDPLKILREQGVTLGAKDLLYVDHRLYGQSSPPRGVVPRYLQVVRAKRFRLVDGEQVLDGHTNATSVGGVLQEHAILLYLADRVSPSPDTPLTDGLEISITRSSPVRILVDGKDLHTRAVGATVNDVLNMVGLSLTGQDYTIPPEVAAFAPDMEINVVRVIENVEVEQAPIPFETVTVTAPDLSPNEQRIIQVGAPGLQESRVRVRRENDRVVSRVVEETWTVVEPIPQIVVAGKSLEGE